MPASAPLCLRPSQDGNNTLRRSILIKKDIEITCRKMNIVYYLLF
jgi:hypothetical protein